MQRCGRNRRVIDNWQIDALHVLLPVEEEAACDNCGEGFSDRVGHEHSPVVLAVVAHDELHDDDAKTRAVQQHEGGGESLTNGLQAGIERAGAGTEPHAGRHVAQTLGENGDEIGVVVEEPRELFGEDEAENAHHQTHHELPDEAHLQRAHEALVQPGAAAVGDQRHHAVGDGVHGDEHEKLHAHERAGGGDGGRGLGGLDGVGGEVENVLVAGDGEDAVGEADDHAGETHVHHVANQLPIGDQVRALDRDGRALGDEIPEAEGHGAGVGDDRGVGSTAYADADDLQENEIANDIHDGGDDHKRAGKHGSSFASHEIVCSVAEVVENICIHKGKNVLSAGRKRSGCIRSTQENQQRITDQGKDDSHENTQQNIHREGITDNTARGLLIMLAQIATIKRTASLSEDEGASN